MYIVHMEEHTEKHQGKIVEAAIKETGYQMKAVARELNIARNTLYIRLKEAQLEDSFIINVSNIIHYDFSKVFPEVYERAKAKVKNKPERFYSDQPDQSGSSDEFPQLPYYEHVYKNPYFIEYNLLIRKYVRLMEDYRTLLKILTAIANNNELIGVKKEITEFLENEKKED